MRMHLGIVAGVCLVSCLVLGCGAGAVASGVTLESGGQPEAGKGFASANELLSALETADQGLHRLSAGVEYTKIFQPDGDIHMRIGRLFFTSEAPAGEAAPPHRRFAVEFTRFWRGDREEKEVQVFAFDGQWLMEKHPGEKWFHLRQVVGPGETFDPLKIGQGPFPLPIGQKKADILAEFDAALLESADGLALENPDAAADAERQQADALIKFVAGCWQVRLTPRMGLEKPPEFSEVRLWYRRSEDGRLLPRMARTVAATDDANIKGDIAIVRLINPRVNAEAEIDEAVFDIKAPDGWDGKVDELPRGGGPGR